MSARRLLIIAMVAAGCHESPHAESGQSTRADTMPRVAPATQDSSRRALPIAGLAIIDSALHWCAVLPGPSLPAGSPLMIVFPDSNVEVAAWGALVVRRRDRPCSTPFAQRSLEDRFSYDLTLVDSLQPDAEETPTVGIAVIGWARWSRGADGIVRADLDGDGRLEEAGVCAVDEGQLFTLGSRDSISGLRHNWFRAYYDWGALVDVTCVPEGT